MKVGLTGHRPSSPPLARLLAVWVHGQQGAARSWNQEPAGFALALARSGLRWWIPRLCSWCRYKERAVGCQARRHSAAGLCGWRCNAERVPTNINARLMVEAVEGLAEFGRDRQWWWCGVGPGSPLVRSGELFAS
jgi:hypothetical protein